MVLPSTQEVYTLGASEVTRGTLSRVPGHVMSPTRVLAAIFVGGCAGGATRDLLDRSSTWVLVLNLAGSLVLGVLVVTAPHHWRPLLGTGFCGGLTTFGTVVVVAQRDLARDRPLVGLGYLFLSLLGGVLAAGVGVLLGHRLGRPELAPEDPDLEVE